MTNVTDPSVDPYRLTAKAEVSHQEPRRARIASPSVRAPDKVLGMQNMARVEGRNAALDAQRIRLRTAVRIASDQHKALEGLCRYITRP